MNKEQKSKKIREARRIARTRKKILVKKTLPRLTVFRSNKFVYAQIIDDNHGKTIVSASEKELKGEIPGRSQRAEEVGRMIAKKAANKKIKNVLFDRGAYKFHGRIKALAEGARKEGLIF